MIPQTGFKGDYWMALSISPVTHLMFSYIFHNTIHVTDLKLGDSIYYETP